MPRLRELAGREPQVTSLCLSDLNNLFNALNLETLMEVTEFKKAPMLETIEEEETAETAPDNLY